MAVNLSSSTLSLNNDRLSLLGAGSNFDTQSLVDMEVQSLEMKNAPLTSQLNSYKSEIQYWNQLKSSLSTYNSTVDALKNLSFSNKMVTGADGIADITAVKSSLNGSYTLEVNQLAKAQKLIGSSIGDASAALGYSGTVQINNKNLDITSDMSLLDITNKINGGSYGANAVVLNGTLVLTSTKTGVDNALNFVDSNSILENLGIVDSTGAVKNEIQKAQDALYSIDGISMQSASNTVSNVMNGVSITLSKTTIEPVEFSIAENNDELKSKVKDFVNGYNTLINTINSYTGKGAVLQGQMAPNKIKTDLANILMGKTDSSLFLYQAGIEMDGTAKDGTLKFDETKLDKLLEENPDELSKLFTGTNSISEKVYSEIDQEINTTGSITSSISGLQKRIDQLNDTIQKNEDNITRQKDSIIQKYAQFEVLMSQLNTQSDYMTAQLSAMNGSDNKN
jgi:flagellar hook-associated protein 2